MRFILRVWLMVLGLFVIATTTAYAKATSKQMPPYEVMSAAYRLYFHDIDTEPENKPKPKRHQTDKWVKSGVLRPIYLSNPKSPDWVIDVNREPSSWLCGTGGCPLQIFVKDASGAYVKAYDTHVREWSLKASKTRKPFLLVDFHGSNCGLSGVEACPFAFEWQAGSGFIESARFTKTVVVRGGALPQAMDALKDMYAGKGPKALDDLIVRLHKLCTQQGAVLDVDSLVSRSPDMNGDGVREWAANFEYAHCSYPPPKDPDAAPIERGDDCQFLACANHLYLSSKQADGSVTWQDHNLDLRDYGFEIRPLAKSGAQFVPILLEPKSGHGPDSDDPCTYYDIKNCLIKPFTLVIK